MALDLNVDTLDAVPEAMRALYIPNGDKFKLDVNGVEDTAGLKSALKAERDLRDKADKENKQWKSLGATPDEIQTLKTASEKAETERMVQASEWDKLKAQQSDLHAKELAKLSETVAAKDRAVMKNVVEAQAVAAVAAAGANKLIMPFVRNVLKAAEINGDYVVQVLNDKGEPRVNANGEFLSVNDLVSEMKADPQYGPLFPPSGASGGGMSQAGSGNTLKTIASSDKSAIGANLEAVAKGTIKIT